MAIIETMKSKGEESKSESASEVEQKGLCENKKRSLNNSIKQEDTICESPLKCAKFDKGI